MTLILPDINVHLIKIERTIKKNQINLKGFLDITEEEQRIKKKKKCIRDLKDSKEKKFFKWQDQQTLAAPQTDTAEMGSNFYFKF